MRRSRHARGPAWGHLWAAGLAASLSLSSPARSEPQTAPEDRAFQNRLFGAELTKDRGHACFRRVYDEDHLARHPKQNVTTMLLLVTGDPATLGARPSYSFTLRAAFRGRGKRLETGGGCGSLHEGARSSDKEQVAHCGVDCDGGSIDVTLKDAATVLVAIPDGARIEAVGEETLAPGRPKLFGSDDKLFRLERAAPAECLPLAADDADKAQLRLGR